VAISPLPIPYTPKVASQFWHVGSRAGRNQSCQISTNFNSIGSGVSEPQVGKNQYLPLTGGIALTTVYALTCYTVIKHLSLLICTCLCVLFNFMCQVNYSRIPALH